MGKSGLSPYNLAISATLSEGICEHPTCHYHHTCLTSGLNDAKHVFAFSTGPNFQKRTDKPEHDHCKHHVREGCTVISRAPEDACSGQRSTHSVTPKAHVGVF